MRNRDSTKGTVRYFYEETFSGSNADEANHYISENCTVRAGEDVHAVGLEGMKQYIVDVRKTYPPILRCS